MAFLEIVLYDNNIRSPHGQIKKRELLRRFFQMASLSLKNVCKVYSNGFEAVKDFNLDVEDK